MANPCALEKTFKKHLEENRWLLNLYWNQTTKVSNIINVICQQFRDLYDQQSDKDRRNFMNAYFEVAKGWPYYRELKRKKLIE